MHYTSDNTLNIPQNSITYNSFSDSADTAELQHPKALSIDNFGEIVTMQTLSALDPEDFSTFFGMEKTTENMQKAFNSSEDNEDFVTYANDCLELTMQTIMDSALDGKIEQAYNLIKMMAGYNEADKAFIADNRNSQEIKDVLPKFLAHRFMYIPDMSCVVTFVSNANELHQARARGALGMNMVDAQNLYQELDVMEGNLTDGQRAKLYFLGAEVFRKANYIPGSYGEPPACDSELRCLQKALLNTSDMKIVTCCYDRMKQQIPYAKNGFANIFDENNHNFIDAYQRVLNNSNHPEDKYKAYQQIASLYEAKTGRGKVSFQPRDYKDTANLKWAEYYRKQAYANAPEGHGLEALNELLKVQQRLGIEANIAATKAERLSYMAPKDRINALIDLAAEHPQINGDKRLKAAWKELKKSGLDADATLIMAEKINYLLPKVSSDQKFISLVEKTVANRKQTPNKQLVRKQSARE